MFNPPALNSVLPSVQGPDIGVGRPQAALAADSAFCRSRCGTSSTHRRSPVRSRVVVVLLALWAVVVAAVMIISAAAAAGVVLESVVVAVPVWYR